MSPEAPQRRVALFFAVTTFQPGSRLGSMIWAVEAGFWGAAGDG